MELKLERGDYIPDGAGGFTSLDGAQALLARVLFRLTARRGQFPFLPELGTELTEDGLGGAVLRAELEWRGSPLAVQLDLTL